MSTELSWLGLFFAWIGFYALHSALALEGWKAFLQRQLGAHFRWYRLLYNLFALTSFLVIWLWQSSLPTFSLVPESVWSQTVAGMLMLSGLVLGYRAMQGYSLGEFSGLGSQTEQDVPLHTEGLNRYMRHPLYSAALLLLLGYACWRPQLPNWIFVSVSILYIWWGSRLEEQKLLRRYGQEYAHYSQSVKRFIPFIW